VLSKANNTYIGFKYIDILNSQLQSFQLKFTERLENRLSSKNIKVLLSNRKLTGRKRIAIDSNVHKLAIFSDELENVKQLNFSLQKFENKGNNKITELRTILQRESTKSQVYTQTQSVNNRKTVKTVMTLIWYRHL
jgi:hypothetical protein